MRVKLPPERLARLADAPNCVAFMYVPNETGDGFVLQPECKTALRKFKKKLAKHVGKARKSGRRDLVSVRQRYIVVFIDRLRQRARGYR